MKATKRQQAFYDESVERIAGIMGVDLSKKKDRKKLTDALELAAATFRAHQNNPAKMPKSRIEEYLYRLQKALAKVHGVVGEGVPHDVEMWLGHGYSDRLMVGIDMMRVDEALAKIKTGKSGRRPDYPLIYLIASLSEIYNDWAGKSENPDDPDRLTKERKEFLLACLRSLGEDISLDKLRRHFREGM